jgi:hypothetical protein
MSEVWSRGCPREGINRWNFSVDCVVKQVYTDECILPSNVAFVWCITSARYYPCQTTRFEAVLNIQKEMSTGTVEGEFLLHCYAV